jgi:hypothetical protein
MTTPRRRRSDGVPDSCGHSGATLRHVDGKPIELCDRCVGVLFLRSGTRLERNPITGAYYRVIKENL